MFALLPSARTTWSRVAWLRHVCTPAMPQDPPSVTHCRRSPDALWVYDNTGEKNPQRSQRQRLDKKRSNSSTETKWMEMDYDKGTRHSNNEANSYRKRHTSDRAFIFKCEYLHETLNPSSTFTVLRKKMCMGAVIFYNWKLHQDLKDPKLSIHTKRFRQIPRREKKSYQGCH